MASSLKNLSDYKSEELKDLPNFRFGIVVSEWNNEITDALLEGALEVLHDCNVSEDNIITMHVPGSFELTSGASFLGDKSNIDAVICLGCIIQGETKHFDFIAQAVANGLTMLCLKYDKPVIFGVLTTDDLQQAKDRSGGKHGNKGTEAAVTAIKMLLSMKKGSGKRIGY